MGPDDEADLDRMLGAQPAAGGPPDPYPLTTLAQGATAMHELFSAYMEAGFTEAQALVLLTATVAQAAASGQPGGPGV